MSNIRKGSTVKFKAGRGYGTGKVERIDGRRVTIVSKRRFGSKYGPKGSVFGLTRDIDEVERA